MSNITAVMQTDTVRANFYSASAWLARAILSVCPSVCLSVRHTPVLCPVE